MSRGERARRSRAPTQDAADATQSHPYLITLLVTKVP